MIKFRPNTTAPSKPVKKAETTDVETPAVLKRAPKADTKKPKSSAKVTAKDETLL